MSSPDSFDRAIEEARALVDSCPGGSRDKAGYLSNLGTSQNNRYMKFGLRSDLEDSIGSARRAALTIPKDHYARALIFFNAGAFLNQRYVKEAGSILDLSEAIDFGLEAAATPIGADSQQAMILDSLGGWLFARYGKLTSRWDIDQAIIYGKRAVAVSKSESELAEKSMHLGDWLQTRYQQFTDHAPDDLDRAIEAGLVAARHLPEDHENRNEMMYNLGQRLFLRYEGVQDMSDLGNSIYYLQEAVRLQNPNDALRDRYCNTLATTIAFRYEKLEAPDDLEAMIQSEKDAISATTQPDIRRHYMQNLHMLYSARCSIVEDSAGLLDAFQNLDSLLGLLDHDDPDRLNLIVRWIRWAATIYSTGGPPPNLSTAISRLDEAIYAEDDPVNIAIYLMNRSVWRMHSYTKNGNDETLKSAIEDATAALDVLPRTRPERGKFLNNKGAILGLKYRQLGRLEDLEEAINCTVAALKTSAPMEEMTLGCLENLGNWFTFRYRLTKAVEDLEEAIEIGDFALPKLPADSLIRPNFVGHVGTWKGLRYLRAGDTRDLEAAIQGQRDAIEYSTTVPSAERELYMCNLAAWLWYRYWTLEPNSAAARADLDEMISIEREASSLEPSPEYYMRRPFTLSNLAQALSARYELDGNQRDLEEAIARSKEALSTTPDDHIDRSLVLNGLATLMIHRWNVTNSLDDIEVAKSLCIEAAAVEGASPETRILSYRCIASICTQTSLWEEASAHLQKALTLLPRICARSLRRKDHQHVLSDLYGLSAVATSITLQAGLSAKKSIVVLEAGRGVMAGIMIDSHSDISALATAYPELCERLETLREILSTPDSEVSQLLGVSKYFSFGREVDIESTVEQFDAEEMLKKSRHQVLLELEDTERQIRSKPGFDLFQLPPSAEDLIQLASRGPIVAVNVTDLRSDAFIVVNTPLKQDVVLLPLPGLDAEELATNARLLVGRENITSGEDDTLHERNKRLRKSLKWLWDVIVQPVLSKLRELGLQPAQDGRLPRLWWLTCGHVGLCPLHAAGHKWGISDENAASQVISSYVPTFKALAHSRSKAKKSSPLWMSHEAIIVSMPRTTGWSDLDVATEVSTIHRHLKSLGVTKQTTLSNPSKATVLTRLQESSIAHFACHGSTHATDPSSSGLYLQDDHLSIHALSALTLPSAQLAYLSACSTAENAAPRLLDEVIHVASAFQLMGFPHVVGTFWEADDEAAADVAGGFYGFLVEEVKAIVGCGRDLDMEDAQDVFAYALHRAVEVVREGRVGGRRFSRNATGNVLAWAAFVHFGC